MKITKTVQIDTNRIIVYLDNKPKIICEFWKENENINFKLKLIEE